ncbi:MAG TPA: ABC transporter permease [Acidobacteriaceae bacterium]|nr:ABC transporter permease [Acidobacteriaceae bacterium]
MRWLSNLRRKRDRDHDLDREVAFHIDALARDYESAGMSPEKARRRARIDFGGREQITQQLREVHISALLETVRANARAAFRFLRKAPGLSAAVILTLALGIGANTAVFSAIEAVILRPLPFPEGEQLMAIRQYNIRTNEPWTFTAPTRLEDWNRLNHTFQAISGYYTEDESETSGPLPERLDNALVAPRFLEVWGIAPELGRDFTPAEEHYGGPDVTLISDRLWRRRFHADPHILGKQLHFGRRASSIVGVLPASFLFPDRDADLFTVSAPDAPVAQDRASTWFTVIGRLNPGVTEAQALADLSTVQRQLGAQFSKTDRDLGVHIEPLKSVIVGGIGSSLWLLYGAVTLLLLIACINIAALLLARTADREREISLRFALGASRRTILTQLLSEVLLLAVIGAILGLALAGGAVQLFHHLAKTLPRAGEITLNWRLLLYTFASALAATLLAGLYPALRSTRRELANSLAQSSHTQVSTRGSLQWLLVGAQVAFAVTLLVGAGLLLRSFEELGRVSPGFNASHVLTLQISGGWGETADMKRLVQRVDGDLDALRAVPGVEAASTAAMLPGVPGMPQMELAIAGQEKDDRQKLFAAERWVSDGYFQALSIPLLLGEDCRNGPENKTMVVNKSFADRYFPQSQAIGHTLQTAASSSFPFSAMIRGVVADAREDGLNTAPVPTIYWCTSAPDPSPWFLIRTKADPLGIVQTIRLKLHQAEPARSVFGISPLTDHISDSLAENRLRTTVLTFFAGTAISLACLGLYGTLSYLGRMRRREMGLRLAIGASRPQIVAALVAQGLRIVVIGCLAGLAMGLAASRLLQGMLYAVRPTDPETYAAIVLLVVVVAVIASVGPALRAATTDPAKVLREE